MKKVKGNRNMFMGFVLAMLFIATNAMAQVPPAGKYNTTNYPEDRKAIEALDKVKDMSKYLNDDFIAIGLEGKIYYGFNQWIKSFADMGIIFKSIKAVPGTSILRIYNGNAAVKNSIADVELNTPQGNKNLRLIFRDSYIKQNNKWYLVVSQGTRQLSKGDIANLSLGSPVKDSIDEASLVPPAGKYNNTNYLEDRKLINDLYKISDSAQHLNDDYIAVGPEGTVSYGLAEWQRGFKETAVRFKAVKLVPDASTLRIYNGDAAVKTFIAQVTFDTPKGDQYITVMRSETYIKQEGRWYFVGGQGTKLLSKNEWAEMIKK